MSSSVNDVETHKDIIIFLCTYRIPKILKYNSSLRSKGS
jgi:hypothetical protein